MIANALNHLWPSTLFAAAQKVLCLPFPHIVRAGTLLVQSFVPRIQ